MRGPPPRVPYHCVNNGSYRERRRARRLALANASAAMAVPIGGPPVPTSSTIAPPWTGLPSTRNSSIGGCSSNGDSGINGGLGGGEGIAELYYNPQGQHNYHHMQPLSGRLEGSTEAQMRSMREVINISCLRDENSQALRMRMALELGCGPRFGDSHTADVVLSLKSSADDVETVDATGNSTAATVGECKGMAEEDNGSREAEETQESGEGLEIIREERTILSPLYLHSKVLCQSEFFEARLSERWRNKPHLEKAYSNDVQAGDRTVDKETSCFNDINVCKDRSLVELTLDNCKDPRTYMRCIQLLYVPNRVKHTCFMSVDDALNVLEVAAELLFHDCVDACMRYLESVPWTIANENAIRCCVSKLHLQMSKDLAARLCDPESIQNVKPVDIMQGVLGELLALVTSGAPPKARDITDRVLFANAHLPSSAKFATVNEVLLFKEFAGNLELLKVQLRKFANFFSWNGHQLNIACSALRWLWDELFALQIADEAIRLFSEEKELAQLMVSRIYQNPFVETLFFMLIRMLQSLQRGYILSPRSVRLALLTTWLPVIARLGSDEDTFAHETQRNMEEGLSAVVETLPIVDQEMVFRIWIGVCLKCRRTWPDLSEVFESWCGKLRQTHQDFPFQKDTSTASTSQGDTCLSTIWYDSR